MTRIKRIFEFSQWSGKMSIKEVNPPPGPDMIEFRWLLDNKDCGAMILKSEGEYASITAYTKKIEDWIPKGVGYDFIKMCIDEILKDKVGVISLDSLRNEVSDKMLEKLSEEYKVTSGMYKGSSAKLITKK